MISSFYELRHLLHCDTARHKGRIAGARFQARVEQLITHCMTLGARTPSQIGRKHLYEWIESVAAPTTRRDRYYAAEWLWEQLDRGKPLFLKKLVEVSG